ncbi:MAG: AAA family ATPase [Chloroflexi bacterium]|nr:AAA family ATPase [Chloroflexota bacterium]
MPESSSSGQSRLSRVPPHDLATEANLLGAALLRAEAAQVVARDVAPDNFYNPAHARIADAIRTLVEAGKPTDVGTVAAHLKELGQADTTVNLRGEGLVPLTSYLVTLQARCPSTASAPTWAAYVAGYARKRHVLSVAGSIVDAVYSGADLGGLVAEMGRSAEEELAHHASTWEAVDLGPALAGEGQEQPAYLLRVDGEALLYPDKVHAFNAEPEAGKSLLAQWACLERFRAGEHVLYVDFEAGPVDVVSRLLDMGAEPSELLDRFHYVRPDDAIDAAARLRISEMLRVWPVSFCVIDGVAEALALSGWEENSGTDVIAFYQALPRLISRESICVVVIDHLVKNKDEQGRYARGSGAKLAGIDGASFKLEVVKPFGRGLSGLARLVITKDRHGWIRRVAAGGTLIAEFHGISDPTTGRLTVELRPSTAVDDQGHFRPTVLMEKVSRFLEGLDAPATGAAVDRAKLGNARHVRFALDALVAEEFVARTDGPRGAKLHRSVQPYRQELEPMYAPEPPDDYQLDLDDQEWWK